MERDIIGSFWDRPMRPGIKIVAETEGTDGKKMNRGLEFSDTLESIRPDLVDKTRRLFASRMLSVRISPCLESF
jgi:hypothetical protein